MSRPLSAFWSCAVLFAIAMAPGTVAAQATDGPKARLEGGTVLVQATRTLSSAEVPLPLVLEIPVPPGGAGTVDVEALLAFQTAGVMAEGLQIGQLSRGAVFCRDVSRGTFTIAPTEMAWLAADGRVSVDILAQPFAYCGRSSQSVILRYPSRSDAVVFPSTVVGRLQERRLVVRNEGTQALSVTTEWSGPQDVSVSPSSAEVPPGGQSEILLVFAPTQAGALSGSLRIATNDPAQAEFLVPVQGTGLAAPRASIQVEPLTTSLFTGGRASRSIRIENQGQSDLTFELLTAGSGEFAGPPGSRILLVQDVAPWGTASNEMVLAAANRSFELVSSSTLDRVDLSTCRRVILAGDQPAAFYDRIRAQLGRLETFVNQGGFLEIHAAGRAFAGGGITSLDLPGGVTAEASSVSQNWATRGHVLLEGFDDHLIWVEYISDPWWFLGTPFSYAHLNNLPPGASVSFREADWDNVVPTMAIYPLGHGTVLVSCQPLELLAKTNPLLRNVASFGWATPAGLPWLSASPRTGVVPSGGTATASASLDAGGNGTPEQSGKLVLRTNDPQHPLLEIPSELHVTAAPDLRAGIGEVIVESRQAFHRRSAYTSQDLALPESGGGTASIRVKVSGRYGYSFREPGGGATARADGQQLPPFGDVGCPGYCAIESLVVKIDATTWALMAANAAVRVEVRNSDDVDTKCDKWHDAKIRYAKQAREIVFDPAFVGTIRSKTLEVSNAGVLPLVVTGVTATPEAFQVSPSALSLAPGETRSVEVRWTAGTGPADGTLTLESDDPDQHRLEIALRGVGMPLPQVAFSPSTIEENLTAGQSARQILRVANDTDSPFTFRLRVGKITRPAASAPVVMPNSPIQVAPASAVAAQSVVATYEIFSDDMENGPGHWTHHADNPAGVDSWSHSTQRSASGNTSWAARQLLAGGSDVLESPLLDLRGARDPVLTFRHWYSFGESYDVGCDRWFDNGSVVDAIRLGQPTSERLQPQGGYPEWLPFWVAPCNPLADQNVYAGDLRSSEFASARFDLGSLAENAVRLRFRTGWRCFIYDPEGWYIDDVKITASSLDWLAVTAQASTVNPHTTGDIEVSFDATALSPGTYTAELVVESDQAPATVVPIRLRVFDLAAAVDVKPDAINPKANTQWISGYVELPTGIDPRTIASSTVRINGVPADPERSTLGDHDDDGVPDLMLKFDSRALRGTLGDGESAMITVAGLLDDGQTFGGSDVVRLISPHVVAPNGGETLVPGNTYAIRWSTPEEWQGVQYDIDASFNGGVSWESIATGQIGSTHEWIVPNRISSGVLVRVRASDEDGLLSGDRSDEYSSIASGTTAVADGAGGQARLDVWPNPCGPRADLTMDFALAQPGRASLRIFDVSGHLVRALPDVVASSGSQRLVWNGLDQSGHRAAAGVYFVQLQTPAGARATRRIVLLR